VNKIFLGTFWFATVENAFRKVLRVLMNRRTMANAKGGQKAKKTSKFV